MHIRQLEISGFKSYKEASLVEEFSPKSNCIVGRNGSGKSNSFRALMFVLGEKSFSQLGHKERSELLHEGAGASVPTAHVEVVFDNAERRFPLDSDEVRLRRTTGLKKDEYFLNNKHVTKSDVVNLLESAGFSRSNPYYIVQQGKVNALCLMKDEQRLDLLKEVAGTTVYEERRRNSESILADTKNKRAKIQDVVSYIEERLDELKDEKEELEAFRSLDRRKRALQYTLHDMELQNATRQLEVLEQEREKEADRTAEASQHLSALREEAEAAEAEVKALEKQLRRAEQESKLTEEECAALVKTKAACELKYKDMVERERMLRDQAQVHEEELVTLNEQIAQMENEVATMARPAFEAAQAEVAQAEAEMRALNQRINQLESKQGRQSQFSSQDERDAWLRREIESIDAASATKAQSIETLRATLADRVSARTQLENEAQMLESQLAEREGMAKDNDDELRNLRNARDEANNVRKDLWRTQERAGREIQDEEDNLRRAERNLQRSMPPAVADGLAAVERIAAELGLKDRVYGPLYELIKPVSEAFETAIEVSVGSSLTHVVVDNDETASRLMQELQRRKAGRVTFKPLQQIRELRQAQGGRNLNPDEMDHDIQGFQDAGDDQQESIPLISRVQYPAEVKDAVRAVLGKVLLCRSSSVAAAQRRALRVNCVTLEGEEVNRRGALTGGYHDARNSKLRAAAALRAAREKVEALRQASGVGTGGESVQAAEQKVTQLTGQIAEVEAARSHSLSVTAQLRGDLKQRQMQLRSAQTAAQAIESSIARAEQGIQELARQRATMEAELATQMLATLSRQEQAELAAAKRDIVGSAGQRVSAAKEALAGAQTTMQRLEAELEQNLKRRKDEILTAMGQARSDVDVDLDPLLIDVGQDAGSMMEVDQAGGQPTGDDASAREARKLHQLDFVVREQAVFKDDLDRAETRLAQAREQHEELEKETSRIRQRVRDLRGNLEELKSRELERAEELRSAEELIEKLVTKARVQMDKREESTRKIRELGSLSSEELNNVGSFRSTKALMTEIKQVNQDLQKYSHVNKKALDQFISFSDRREMLLKRKEELDRGEQSIQDLIEHLDRQKDEDIMRTFRGVAKNFREVFAELVPAGKGELAMVTRTSAAEEKERRKQMRRSAREQGNDPADVDLGEDDEEEEDGLEAKTSSASSGGIGSVDEFIGISPRVTFTDGGQQFSMRQLSGGQRALVALTLIFAIQRCDPAPFYLFDEIDQALDQNYRASVAKMIKRQAEHAQFIVTTFRPELVRVTDRCFGIQFQNKVSSIVPLSSDEALEFVETIAAAENAQASGPSSRRRRKRKEPQEAGSGSDGGDDMDEGDDNEEGDDNDDDGGGNDDNEYEGQDPSSRRSASGKRVRA
ncbi:Structural maintenance of chromosomes protein 3 [Hondaea fermentalgiana]|uniref:Structural maintenance of chromosomes protein n=1 Tax=Hondaea fermentalgiana TaxID=2315210 RepID=A0A2R5GIR7_9STRA|nr:Structural maintenance of chromosomes protein 3 [Hondaea fermentalgiana]|eukprot:GBG27764.1 Structural maintenance of chromosomes protein 3 [Hondaea fermentalgiana]